MVYDKPIIIEKLDDTTEKFCQYYQCHAYINKTSGKEYMASGTEKSSTSLFFQMRYCPLLKNIQFEFEKYRIKYSDYYFYIQDADNVKLNNRDIKIIGDIHVKQSH